MKKLKIYFGAVALMLLATQCNMLPWFPVDQNPYVEPVVTPHYTSGYNVEIGDTVAITLRANATAGYHWCWINKVACANVDSVDQARLVQSLLHTQGRKINESKFWHYYLGRDI